MTGLLPSNREASVLSGQKPWLSVCFGHVLSVSRAGAHQQSHRGVCGGEEGVGPEARRGPSSDPLQSRRRHQRTQESRDPGQDHDRTGTVGASRGAGTD